MTTLTNSQGQTTHIGNSQLNLLTYQIYGLQVHTNLPLPGMIPISDPQLSADDVYIDLAQTDRLEGILTNQVAWHSFLEDDGGTKPRHQVRVLPDHSYFRFTYPDQTDIIIEKSGRRLWAYWPDSLTLEDTCTYLLGPILGYVLRLRGITCLHASAVAVDGRALILLAPGGGGKSTTAATFAKLGYPIVSDDVSPLYSESGRIIVYPGYPRLRLWPSSVEYLFGSSDALPPLTPNWEKCFLDLTQKPYQFQQTALPIGGIYFLRGSKDHSSLSIENIPNSEKLVSLLTNTYGNTLLEKAMRSEEFEMLGRVIKEVPVQNVFFPKNASLLPQLCELILRDFRKSHSSVNN
jgi:hypothetical protein